MIFTYITYTYIYKYIQGERSNGTREDIIEYMTSVGYQYLPWGHQVIKGQQLFDVSAFC